MKVNSCGLILLSLIFILIPCYINSQSTPCPTICQTTAHVFDLSNPGGIGVAAFDEEGNNLTGFSVTITDGTSSISGTDGSTGDQDSVPPNYDGDVEFMEPPFLSGSVQITITKDGYAPVTFNYLYKKEQFNQVNVDGSLGRNTFLPHTFDRNGAGEIGVASYTELKSVLMGARIAIEGSGCTMVATDGGLGDRDILPNPSKDGDIELDIKSIRSSLLKTVDGGSSWTSQGVGIVEELNDIYCIDTSNCIAVGKVGKGGGAVYKTSDGGTNWSKHTSGVAVNLNGVYCIGSTCFAVGNSGTVIKSTDGGISWSRQTSGVTDNLNSIYCLDANTCFAVGNSGKIIKTTNGGTNWGGQDSKVTDNLNSIYCLDANTCTCFAVGNNGKIIKTTDGGTNWSSQISGTSSNLNNIHCLDADTCYVVGDGGKILKTTNGGTIWSDKSKVDVSITYKSIFCTDAKTCLITGVIGKILKTADGGDSWDDTINSGVDYKLNNIYCPDSTTCFTVGEAGGCNWLDGTLLTVTISKCGFVDKNFYFTYNRNAFNSVNANAENKNLYTLKVTAISTEVGIDITQPYNQTKITTNDISYSDLCDEIVKDPKGCAFFYIPAAGPGSVKLSIPGFALKEVSATPNPKDNQICVEATDIRYSIKIIKIEDETGTSISNKVSSDNFTGPNINGKIACDSSNPKNWFVPATASGDISLAVPGYVTAEVNVSPSEDSQKTAAFSNSDGADFNANGLLFTLKLDIRDMVDSPATDITKDSFIFKVGSNIIEPLAYNVSSQPGIYLFAIDPFVDDTTPLTIQIKNTIGFYDKEFNVNDITDIRQLVEKVQLKLRAKKIAFSPTKSNLTAGQTSVITVKVLDYKDRIITTEPDDDMFITVTLSGGSSSPPSEKKIIATTLANGLIGDPPITATGNLTSGQATITITDTIVGDGTDIVVSASGTNYGGEVINSTGNDANINVIPAGVNHLDITPEDGVARAAGNTNRDELVTLQLKDRYGNNVSMSLSIQLSVSGSAKFTQTTLLNATPSLPTNSLSGRLSASGGAKVTVRNDVAESVVVTASVTGLSSVSCGIVFEPGDLHHLKWTIATRQKVNKAFSGTNTLAGVDENNNVIPSFASDVNLSVSSGSISPTSITADKFINGIVDLTALNLTYTGDPGEVTFTATTSDGKTSGEIVITMIGDAVKALVVLPGQYLESGASGGVKGEPLIQSINTPFYAYVRAVDSNNSVDPEFNGSVEIKVEPNDPNMEIYGPANFIYGQARFTVLHRLVGNYTITPINTGLTNITSSTYKVTTGAPLLYFPSGEFSNDGVEPNSGTGGTSFTFKVKYLSPKNLQPNIIQVWVDTNRNGIFDTDEKFDLLEDASTKNNTYKEGKLYYRELSIAFSGNINPAEIKYRFYAKDSEGSLAIDGETGGPTQEKKISISNNKPSLAFLGPNYSGFESDGVNPNSGSIGTTFTFKVRYTDLDNQEPKLALLWLDRNGDGEQQINELYPMSKGMGDGNDKDGLFSNGEVYYAQVKLDSIIDNKATVSYKFIFSDGVVEPGSDHPYEAGKILLDSPFPIVLSAGGNSPPQLSYLGAGGYVNKGVYPTVGNSGDTFTFKVKYTDAENSAPVKKEVWLDLNADNKIDVNEIFEMTIDTEETANDGNYTNGEIFKMSTVLHKPSGSNSISGEFHFSDGSSETTLSIGVNITINGSDTDNDGVDDNFEALYFGGTNGGSQNIVFTSASNYKVVEKINIDKGNLKFLSNDTFEVFQIKNPGLALPESNGVFLLGITGIKISGLTPFATVKVAIELPSSLPQGVKLYKLVNNIWKEVNYAKETDTKISFEVTDNNELDGSATLGEIEDPFGLFLSLGSSEAGGGGGGGGCFIATAVYGDYNAPEVRVLRKFRDEILLKSEFGKSLVNTYYKVSPLIAEFIRYNKNLKLLMRILLQPVVLEASQMISIEGSE